MQIEVVYAKPEHQALVSVQLPNGATVADALDAVAEYPDFCGLALATVSVGIFGQLCERSQLLCSGDRVEIYRELMVDAKTARQRRAVEQKLQQR